MLKEPKQARVYEGYTTQMVLNASNDSGKVKTDAYEKKGQKRWRYRDIEEWSLPAHVEDSKSDWKSVLKEKKPSTSLRSRHKSTKCDSLESAHTAEAWQSDMEAVMSRLSRH